MTSTSEQQSQVYPAKVEPIFGKAPEPIFGQIINLLYVRGSGNLRAIAIQDEKNPAKIFLLGADPDSEFGSDMIKISNLNNFKAKLEKVFDNEYYINIDYADDQINSIIIVKLQPMLWNRLQGEILI
ncbi:MAG: hypothetical protein ACRC2S_26635 [Waterburya sp.]